MALSLNQIAPTIGPLAAQNAVVKNRNHNAAANLAGVHGLINANFNSSMTGSLKASVELKGSFQSMSYQSI